jgi:hypothetical protein
MEEDTKQAISEAGSKATSGLKAGMHEMRHRTEQLEEGWDSALGVLDQGQVGIRA